MSDPKAEPPDDGTVRMMDYFMELEYHEPLCPVVSRYADELLEGRIIAHQCPSCGLVYAPPRGYCPICVVETTDADEVVLADRGVITNYTVVTPVQYYGQQETEPFVRASILLDGVGGMMNLQDVIDIPVDEVHVGQRVEAVWKPEPERSIADVSNRSWGGAEGCIVGWRPTGEPDVPADQLQGRAF
jgi:uncharacterized OB-fold protein